MQALLSVVLAFHVGGVPTPAKFVDPKGVGAAGDQSFDVKWTDGDMDPTGKFSFYYQVSNVPPNATLSSPSFMGVAIPEAQQLPILSTMNDFQWNTSAIASGSYYLYAITTDPPLMPVWE